MRTSNEACLRFTDQENLAEIIAAALTSHCKEQRWEGDDLVLELEASRAVIRPVPGMLWLRVDAVDLLTSIGTRMLLESALRMHRDDAPKCVLWVQANEEPFAAVRAIIKSGQITSC